MELVARALDERAARFGRRLQDVRDVDSLAPQLDRPARDTRDVEQIVHEPRQVQRLPVDDVRRPPEIFGGGGAGTQYRCRMTDRTEGVAQLVGEQRKKLILLYVGFFELALRALL